MSQSEAAENKKQEKSSADGTANSNTESNEQKSKK